MRIGHGYDVHRLTEGRKLIIGGVDIPYKLGLLGHSDADVLLHAISDAILGAAALGDIGGMFPDTDDKWKGADSLKLLEAVVKRVNDEGYFIENIDSTLIAQQPKMKPHIPFMRENIAKACGVDILQVSVKATTEEQLGFTGRQEGISAHAADCPELGRSALDAVELMNVGVQFLREHMTSDCRIHYAITNAGGVSPNVVQSEADVLYMVRANKVRQSIELQKRVDKIAEGAALMTETSFERVFIDGTAELLPNFTIEKLLYDNFTEIGVPQYTPEELDFAQKLKATYPAETKAPGIGAAFDDDIGEQVQALTENMTKPINDFLMPLYSCLGFIPGSTDVGDVSWQTPTSQTNVVTWPAGMPGHTWQTVACGKTSIAYKGMLCAGKVLAATAIDLFEDGEILNKAKAEFEKRSKGGYVCPIEPGAKPIAL